jgi:hypothetical protein
MHASGEIATATSRPGEPARRGTLDQCISDRRMFERQGDVPEALTTLAGDAGGKLHVRMGRNGRAWAGGAIRAGWTFGRVALVALRSGSAQADHQ